MRKINKKVVGILGTLTLALGVFAIPTFAETSNQNPMGTGNMQSFMTSGTMQNIHNSQAMQEAMTTGDFTKMAEAMNTPEMKEIMGEEHINQMTEYMKNGNGMMGGATGSNMMSGFGSNLQ